MQKCPLCNNQNVNLFYQNKVRNFLLCDNCNLIFVPSEFHLTNKDEKNEYDLHDNDISDIYYRKFLNRLAAPVLEKLKNDNFFDHGIIPKGLDFGCGFAPALVAILEGNGCMVEKYDKFYFTETSVLKNNNYDFITTTEVVEHLANPHDELLRLWNCLKNSNSFLAIMTKLVDSDAFADKKIFANWHYIRDLTHISFYSQKTCEYIAGNLFKSIDNKDGVNIDFIGNDVVIFNK